MALEDRLKEFIGRICLESLSLAERVQVLQQENQRLKEQITKSEESGGTPA